MYHDIECGYSNNPGITVGAVEFTIGRGRWMRTAGAARTASHEALYDGFNDYDDGYSLMELGSRHNRAAGVRGCGGV
jgi:hypothetical protein